MPHITAFFFVLKLLFPLSTCPLRASPPPRPPPVSTPYLMLEMSAANAKIQQQDAQISKLLNLFELLGYGDGGRGGGGGGARRADKAAGRSRDRAILRDERCCVAAAATAAATATPWVW